MYEPPINWTDYEDIALALYERFGDEFDQSKIYRIRFTDLLDWVLETPNFEGKREESNEGPKGPSNSRVYIGDGGCHRCWPGCGLAAQR